MSESGPNGGDRRWFFVSDIDDTLTGDWPALAQLADLLNRNRGGIVFVVNSSRPLASVASTLRDYFPPSLKPDATITAMGTEVYLAGHRMDDWQRQFEGWPKNRIYELVKSLGFQPHDPAFQTDLKVSFSVPGAEAQKLVTNALEQAGLKAMIIVSGAGDFDILPPGAGKAAATRYLAGAMGCPFNRIVASGDSGNDAALLRSAQYRIVVGNARPELIKALCPLPFFHAGKGHAAGVQEGLIHFGVLPR